MAYFSLHPSYPEASPYPVISLSYTCPVTLIFPYRPLSLVLSGDAPGNGIGFCVAIIKAIKKKSSKISLCILRYCVTGISSLSSLYQTKPFFSHQTLCLYSCLPCAPPFTSPTCILLISDKFLQLNFLPSTHIHLSIQPYNHNFTFFFIPFSFSTSFNSCLSSPTCIFYFNLTVSLAKPSFFALPLSLQPTKQPQPNLPYHPFQLFYFSILACHLLLAFPISILPFL